MTVALAEHGHSLTGKPMKECVSIINNAHMGWVVGSLINQNMANDFMAMIQHIIIIIIMIIIIINTFLQR